MIKDGETGLLVEPEADEQLATSIEMIFSSPQLAKSLTRKARTFVEQQFDLTANALTLAALILPRCAPTQSKASDQASTPAPSTPG